MKHTLHHQISELETDIDHQKIELSVHANNMKRKLGSTHMLAKMLVAGFAIGYFLLPHRGKLTFDKNKNDEGSQQISISNSKQKHPLDTKLFKGILQILKSL